jgi:hypothetical protein
MSLARNYKEGVHPTALDNVGGFLQGQVAIYDAPSSVSGDYQVKLPTGTQPWLQPPFGIADSAGFVGGAGSVSGEALSLARQGLWRALLSANQTVTRGGEAMADAGTLGNVIQRTAFSFSAWVLGTFEEGYGPSTTADLVEMYAQPYLKEVVRQVTAGATTALGAATKFATAPGQAGAAAQIPLYVARFTGETVRNLQVCIATAPGGTDTVIFTIQKSSDNGATWTDTTITCTPVAGTGKTGSDLTHSVMLTAGDMLALKMVSSGATAAAISATFDVT